MNSNIVSGAPCDELMMGDLKSALSICPNIVSLRLERCTHLSSLLAQFLKEHAPFLSRVELPGCSISDSFLIELIRGLFSLISGARSLRQIDVSYSNVSLATLPLLVRECQFLESLNMNGCREAPEDMVVDYETSEYYLVGETLKQYRNTTLRELSLSQTRVDDTMIGYIVRHCDSIEILFLDGCDLLTDVGINSIAMHTPNIKELNLAFCSEITDLSLQSLAIHLSSLSKLPKPRPVSYAAFSQHEPVQRSAGRTSVPLHTIVLSGCQHVTKAGLILLASKCINLKTIVLDGVDSVTDWYYGPSHSIPMKIPEQDDSDTESYLSALSHQSLNLRSGRASPIRTLLVSNSQILEK